MSEWISVESRLPADYERVEIKVWRHDGTFYSVFRENVFYDDEMVDTFQVVTHWRAVPKSH